MPKFSKTKSTLIHQMSTKLEIYLLVYYLIFKSTFMLKESKESKKKLLSAGFVNTGELVIGTLTTVLLIICAN